MIRFFIVAGLILFGPQVLYCQNSALLDIGVSDGNPDSLQVIKSNFFKQDTSTLVRNTSGRFAMLMDVDNQAEYYILLSQHKIPFFIADSLSAFISIDEKDVKISYTGDFSKENSLLFEIYQKYSFQQDIEMNGKSIDMYEIQLFDIKRERWNLIKEVQSNLNIKFRQYIAFKTEYSYYSNLFRYSVENLKNDRTARVIPEIMLSKLEERLINNPSSIGIKEYRDFVWYFAMYKALEEAQFVMDQDSGLFTQRLYRAMRDNYTGVVFNFALTRLLIDRAQQLDKSSFEELKDKLKQSAPAELMEQLNGVEPGLKEDHSAKNTVLTKRDILDRDFTFIDEKGKEFHLLDFKGKVIYIDLWASWCGPCRQQFPYAEDLKRKLTKKQKKKITFLYISLDKSEESWKKALKSLNPEGERGIAPGAWNSEIAKYFNVQSIPRYILIDKHGAIVNRNAIRPSDPSLLDKLIKLSEE